MTNPLASSTSSRDSSSFRQTDSLHNKPLGPLILAAIGVVFGDIGTSPLYALKECFDADHGVPLTNGAILGIISMMFWALMLVVTIKYVVFVLSASNNGEGGVLSLMALTLRTAKPSSHRYLILMMLGLLGASMLYGESVITPAISVLSAVEGLNVAAPGLSNYVIPITLAILVALFCIQKHGTATVGKLFGPVTLLWFAVLGVLGIINIFKFPSILLAINPMYAVNFITAHTLQAYIVMGSVVLVVTGVEALSLDMGHFGAKPVRIAWVCIALPCLLLNYFGQGALIITHPEAAHNPFFLMVPEIARMPVVILAMMATIIASQAVISGAFSLTSQAILLGFLPRMKIVHTSATEKGQIYIPLINWVLLLMVMATVLVFQESAALAAAYGISVTTTMLITTVLVSVVMKREWGWNRWLVGALITSFFIIDFSFWFATLIKIKDGGWFPLSLGAGLFFIFMTWYSGRRLLRAANEHQGLPLRPFMNSLLAHPPHRVAGTAIFLSSNLAATPAALLHNLKHNRVLHERVVFLKISIFDIPYVADNKRLALTEIGDNIYTLRAIFGFKESPDIELVIRLAREQESLDFDMMDTSFFLSRDTVVPCESLAGMAIWRERLFAWMYQNSSKSSDFFNIPSNRVVELGTKIEI